MRDVFHFGLKPFTHDVSSDKLKAINEGGHN